MPLIDFSVQERKGANVFNFKVPARPEDALHFVVKKALKKYLQRSGSSDCIDTTLKRI